MLRTMNVSKRCINLDNNANRFTHLNYMESGAKFKFRPFVYLLKYKFKCCPEIF